jgi:hypothetical protein
MFSKLFAEFGVLKYQGDVLISSLKPNLGSRSISNPKR